MAALEAEKKIEEEEREAKWREGFEPHAIIETEREVPFPVFIAVFGDTNQLRYVPLDQTLGRRSFVHQTLSAINQRVRKFERHLVSRVSHLLVVKLCRASLLRQSTIRLMRIFRRTLMILNYGRVLKSVWLRLIGQLFDKALYGHS